jgi:hypothetical protein
MGVLVAWSNGPASKRTAGSLGVGENIWRKLPVVVMVVPVASAEVDVPDSVSEPPLNWTRGSGVVLPMAAPAPPTRRRFPVTAMGLSVAFRSGPANASVAPPSTRMK